MSKYKLLKDYPLTHADGSIETLGAGTLFFENCHGTYGVGCCSKCFHSSKIENNPDWFEKVEEPYISRGEGYYTLYGDGDICRHHFSDADCKKRLDFGNCFPEKKFTRGEVQAIADEVKALFKKHQQSK